ncbi:uncharacterized protein KY384_008020 [Bacidia gigantensis]|uniref:uncharacterized protein n=1 Tax=Bacidia gigantensis TaxID=2732470 RepID=UPI001D042DB9|nr:uncharacterized protein KY384_008020 [Bacidia gigantensis]KAG8527276.1 hypothetical protein KY384_008020 [Bacidia gigantensis]
MFYHWNKRDITQQASPPNPAEDKMYTSVIALTTLAAFSYLTLALPATGDKNPHDVSATTISARNALPDTAAPASNRGPIPVPGTTLNVYIEVPGWAKHIDPTAMSTFLESFQKHLEESGEAPIPVTEHWRATGSKLGLTLRPTQNLGPNTINFSDGAKAIAVLKAQVDEGELAADFQFTIFKGFAMQLAKGELGSLTSDEKTAQVEGVDVPVSDAGMATT